MEVFITVLEFHAKYFEGYELTTRWRKEADTMGWLMKQCIGLIPAAMGVFKVFFMVLIYQY